MDQLSIQPKNDFKQSMLRKVEELNNQYCHGMKTCFEELNAANKKKEVSNEQVPSSELKEPIRGELNVNDLNDLT